MNQPHIELAEERYIPRRSSQLERITELRRSVVEAIAWSELGYSVSGISKQMDTTESTIKSYLELAMARYGLEIAQSLGSHEELREPEEVSTEYLFDLPDQEKARWIGYVARHGDKLDDDWVRSVLDTASSYATTHEAPELESVIKNQVKKG